MTKQTSQATAEVKFCLKLNTKTYRATWPHHTRMQSPQHCYSESDLIVASGRLANKLFRITFGGWKQQHCLQYTECMHVTCCCTCS